MKYICDSCEKYPCSADETKLMLSCPAYSPKPKPQTNADRIRAMTDEELALFIHNAEAQAVDTGLVSSVNGWLEWLKQEGE